MPNGMALSISGRSIHITGTATTPGLYRFNITISGPFGSYLVKTVTMNVINIGYSSPITIGFTAPSVLGTVTSSIASPNYALNDILHLARQVGGVNTKELGTFKITGYNVPSIGFIELTNLTATPGVEFVPGDVAYWDFDGSSIPAVGGQFLSFQLPAVGGSGSYTWTETGILPAGLTMDDTGLITGTPQADDTSNFVVRVMDNECTGQSPPSPPTGPTIYWGILDAQFPQDPYDIFVTLLAPLSNAIAGLQSETGPLRTGGYHLRNPSGSTFAYGWFGVPDSLMTPLDTTGFKWHASAAASPLWNVMNNANYNVASPPFPPDATILNVSPYSGDHVSNGWYYYTATWNSVLYRFYIFAQCTIAAGGFDTLNGAIGSNSFTLFVSI